MTYIVKTGDTLSAIAERHLGAASRWRELFALNAEHIHAAQNARGLALPPHEQPNVIFPGTVLVMPPEPNTPAHDDASPGST
jgi:nucleoid-associated protein YgaU